MTDKTTSTWVTLLLILLVPGRAAALGLGDIKTESYLNEPLNARIGVMSAPPELGAARISLASVNFKKGSSDPRRAPESVAFKLEKEPDGQTFIRVTSQKPIKEPALDFVVQVAGPKGDIAREYAVLLDPRPLPPVAPVATRTPASSSDPAGTRLSAQANASSMGVPPGVRTRSIEPELTDHGYGPTMRPNVLWRISRLIRPSNTVSIPQVMLAVVKENPEAFYDHNVNELKAGYVLRIPDQAAMKAVDADGARREVRTQWQHWRRSRGDSRFSKP